MGMLSLVLLHMMVHHIPVLQVEDTGTLFQNSDASETPAYVIYRTWLRNLRSASVIYRTCLRHLASAYVIYRTCLRHLASAYEIYPTCLRHLASAYVIYRTCLRHHVSESTGSLGYIGSSVQDIYRKHISCKMKYLDRENEKGGQGKI